MAKDIDLVQVQDLASKGYNVSMISDALGISRSTAYSNKSINSAIKAGHSTARQKVVNDLMTRSESDISATASIFLAKQLKVFDDYYATSTPKNISEALKKIIDIYKSVANNTLDATKADKLIHYLQAYVKGYEVNELDKRLQELENYVNEQK